jgi:hypothetical protein
VSRHGSDPFPVPAHRTGRADFPHPALRLASWQGLGGDRAIQLPLQAPELFRRLQAHRQSPLLACRQSAPEVRTLPSTGITRLQRYYDPVRLPDRPALAAVDGSAATGGISHVARNTFPTCRPHYPGGSSRCRRRSLPCPCCLPGLSRRSASATPLSRLAQGLLTLRPAELLDRPRRPLSRGFVPPSHPGKTLASYQFDRQLTGWILLPLVFRAFVAHGEGGVRGTFQAFGPVRSPLPGIRAKLRGCRPLPAMRGEVNSRGASD